MQEVRGSIPLVSILKTVAHCNGFFIFIYYWVKEDTGSVISLINLFFLDVSGLWFRYCMKRQTFSYVFSNLTDSVSYKFSVGVNIIEITDPLSAKNKNRFISTNLFSSLRELV